MINLSDYWPKALIHLREPYDDGASDHVVIAEISEAPHSGYEGVRKLSTALVPLKKLNDVLEAPGSIGWEVKCWGPHPCVEEGEIFDTHFWVDGRKGTKEKFQTIINAWNHHNREVLLPDNVMLMTYGLVPRYFKDGIVSWDDPHAPVYDVLQAKSHVNYGTKGPDPLAQITMRRDYLEDYCSLKGCAAIAVYYEQRFSSDDETFESILKGRQGVEFELPGRRLAISVFKDKHHAAAPQLSKVWGCRLILSPARRPITDAEDPLLVWPGDDEPMTLQRASASWVYGYVSDEVLCDYEARPEFDVHPESGGVSYNGWWSIGYCDRVGRNHIRVELKKLYEGCPPHVIAHWHRFAVAENVAEFDRKTHADMNIGVRGKGVAGAYLRLTESLEALSDCLRAGFTQKDIGSLATKEVEYVGWWTVPVLKPLGAIARQTATREQFLARAVSLFQLLENLKPAPLRNLALSLRIPKATIQEVGSLKLLACLCQLSVIAAEQGHVLPADTDIVVKQWSPEAKIDALSSLFALNGLRILATHAPSAEQDRKIAEATAVFGIDAASTHAGWGYAADRLYDRLTDDLNCLAGLLEPTAS